MRLRQVAFVARELKPVVEDLCAVLGIEVGFNDPGVGKFGLENAVIPIGDTFLEVVAPVEENTTAGRYLERRKGDGGYMAIFQTPHEIDDEKKRVEGLGIRVIWEIRHDDAQAIHLHPRDVGGAIVSLDHMTPTEHWKWAGPDWRNHVKTEVVTGIAGIELQSSDPSATANRWAEALNLPEPDDAGGVSLIPLDRGLLRFAQDTDGRGDGIRAMTVGAKDVDRILDTAKGRGLAVDGGGVTICGVNIQFTEV